MSSISVPVTPPTGAKDNSLLHATSRSIARYSVPALRSSALGDQSVYINTLSGATYTSEGFLRSLQGAIAKMSGWLTPGTVRGPLEVVEAPASAPASQRSMGRFGEIQVVVSGFAPAVSLAVEPKGGYLLAAANAALEAEGGASVPTFSLPHSSPITQIIATPDGQGLYLLAANGQVLVAGSAVSHGSASGALGREPHDEGDPLPYAVGMITAPGDTGYLVLTDQGVVIPVGQATSLGEVAQPRNPSGPSASPLDVAIMATPDGQGYWIFSRSGHVYRFGDAVSYGSAPLNPGNSEVSSEGPVVAAAVTPDGKGYWLFTSDGGVYPFGDAISYGSPQPGQSSGGVTTFINDIVAAAATPDGLGYYLLGANGTVYPYGDAAS